jgi:hypothetical protein
MRGDDITIDAVWDDGIPLLKDLDVPKGRASAMIGRWLKVADGITVLEAIRSAHRHDIRPPMAWITKCVYQGAARAEVTQSKSIGDACERLFARAQELEQRELKRNPPGYKMVAGPVAKRQG